MFILQKYNIFRNLNEIFRPEILQDAVPLKNTCKNYFTPFFILPPAQLDSSLPSDSGLLQSLDDVTTDPLDPDARLQTTLLVSTLYPPSLRAQDEFLRVATIRSPYSFDVDDGAMSTRLEFPPKQTNKKINILCGCGGANPIYFY